MGMNIVVIGGGPGGYVAAVRAAQGGAKVTLIEQSKLGGTCLNNGCIPSKILKETADLMDHFHRAGHFGITLEGRIAPDMGRVMERKKTLIDQQIKNISNLLHHNQVTLINGRASVKDPKMVEVKKATGETISILWDTLVLAPGTTPLEMPHLPFDGERILSSDHLLNIQALPQSMAILGGGVIGCEFAFIISALGVDVTLIEAMPQIIPLPSVDPDISKILERELKKRKITLFTGHTVTDLKKEPNALHLTLSKWDPVVKRPLPSSSFSITSDTLLVSVGRKPLTADLGLETIGVHLNQRGWVNVDKYLRTNIPNVYAVGDILGPEAIMLAHVAWAEGDIAAQNIMGKAVEMRYDLVPTVLFTSPEIGCAGLTEEQARAKGLNVRSDTVLFRTIAKAHILGDIAGQAKIVSESESGKIVGVHMIGPHVDDLIAEGVMAIRMGATVTDLATVIHAHPTLSEVMMETAFKASGRPLHG